jgi:hypothetical protein
MNLPVNLRILLRGLLKPINYGKKSIVDNVGPCVLLKGVVNGTKNILVKKMYSHFESSIVLSD